MHLVVFGLTVSSSWGNGHATLWRSLIKAMLRRGHTIHFYERDQTFYADARDLHNLPDGADLILYDTFPEVHSQAARDLRDADLALCTSYCPDGPAASALILDSVAAIKAFYDLDTPVTLDALERRDAVAYLPAEGLSNFDLVLSFTGGRALSELQTRLGARCVAPLYGSVDPDVHHPVPSRDDLRSTLSYLGTYAPDRQQKLRALLMEPAERAPTQRFLLGGAQYPDALIWAPNVSRLRHVPPADHPVFFCSSRMTLNVTRGAMARYGFCPQGRLFEAAACGVPLLSDAWEGLDSFFQVGREIVEVTSTEDVLTALQYSDAELHMIAAAARERVLAEHTGESRIIELEHICDRVRSGSATANVVPQLVSKGI